MYLFIRYIDTHTCLVVCVLVFLSVGDKANVFLRYTQVSDRNMYLRKIYIKTVFDQHIFFCDTCTCFQVIQWLLDAVIFMYIYQIVKKTQYLNSN